ncbi:hypothetical protein C8R45DRAFT_1220531 [Mycena sanguinolenta]|nr:hypothetical protein C8R45DRAFT_1220531 [Mycena sanguinolenta]
MQCHESLHLQTLSTLPFIQRATAKSAVNGSAARLHAIVVQIAELGRDGHRFLPVLYHHLDPTKIPSEDTMDTEILSNHILDTISRAFLSLIGVYNLVYPPAGSDLDLWERVWPWIQFFDVYHSRIPDAPTQDIVRARFFSIIACMSGGAGASRISSTRGVGALVARFWASYFQDPTPASENSFRRLGTFLIMTGRSGYDFEEYIDGAGGVHALAKLVVQLVDYLLSWDDVSRVEGLGGVVSFAAEAVEAWPSESDAWLSALQLHNYARALMSVLSFTENFVDVNRERELVPALYKLAWNQLFQLFRVSIGYADIMAAIRAGLLQRIVSLPNTHADWDMTDGRDAIKLVVQPATLYYPVLSAVKAFLPLLAESTWTTAFISSTLHADWEEFVDLVLDRLEVKQGFDSGQYLTRKACDNLKCGRILRKMEFQRCAGCRYAHYCSRDCQIKDWIIGHRAVCQDRTRAYGRYGLMNGPKYLRSRDRAFIRAMVMHDYERHKQYIFLTLIMRLREHGENVFAEFDYSTGRVQIDVCAVKETANSEYLASRAAQSGRRMHLNLVFLPNQCMWMLPIRSSESGVHDALFTLSQSVPPGTDSVSDLSPAIRRAVTHLVEEVCPTITEIV